MVLVVAMLVMSLPSPAGAQESLACTESVDVGWEVDHDSATITAAVIHATGCEDGDLVGVRLRTRDGEWTPEEPVVASVVDEVARVDLARLGLRMEPVVGVRVALYGDGLVEHVEIVVDARFFNPAGDEQRGLRDVTELDLELNGEYVVPEAPARYASVDCTTVGVDVSGTVGEGPGTYAATEAGRHVVCYRQRSGSPSPVPDEGGVLGVDVDPPSVVAAPPGTTDGAVDGGQPLGVTGQNVVILVAGGLLLLVAGTRLVHGSRRS